MSEKVVVIPMIVVPSFENDSIVPLPIPVLNVVKKSPVEIPLTVIPVPT